MHTICIMRVWKRDGSRNYMGVVDALLNLEQNALRPLSENLDHNRDLTRRALLRGEVIHTPLAWFVIEAGSLEALTLEHMKATA